MKLLKTKIDGPMILKSTVYIDRRGYFKEVYRKNILKKTQTFSESYYPTGNIFYSSSEKLIKTKHYNFNYIPYMIETFRAIDIDNTDDLKLTKKIYKLL